MTDFLSPVIARLEGDISDYLAKLAAADEAMQKFGKGVPEGLSRQRGPIGDEGTKAGQAYGGKFSDTVTKQVDKALKDLPDVKVTADSSEADRKLADIRTKMEALRNEKIGVTIDEKGVTEKLVEIRAEIDALSKTAKIPLKFDLKESSAALAEAEKFVTDVTTKMGSGGDKAGTGFFGRILGAFKKAGPQFEAAGEAGSGLFEGGFTSTAAIAAYLPIGTMIGDAVVAGIGLAGIGLGIVAELHDPQVQAAITKFGADLKQGSALAAQSFVTPLTAGLQTLDKGFQAEIPKLTTMFQDIAPSLDGLSRGIADMLGNITDGFANAVIAAKPLIDTVGKELPGVGMAISNAFAMMSEDSAGASRNLHTLFVIIDDGIEYIGAFVLTMNKMSDAVVWLADQVGRVNPLVAEFDQHFLSVGGDGRIAEFHLTAAAQAMQDLGGAAAATTNVLGANASQFQTLTQELTKTTDTADTFAGAMTDKVLNALLGVANAELGVHTALSALSDSLKQNGRNFDENTAKGQANMQALLADVAANQRLYDQNIASGMSAQDAAAKYDANTAALERQLRKAGLTQQQVNQLVGAYAGVPDNVNTNIKAANLTNVLGLLQTYLEKLLGINHTFTTTIRTVFVTSGKPPTYSGKPGVVTAGVNQFGGIQHFDVGGAFQAGDAGIVSGGGPFAMFGEPGTGAQVEGFLPRSGIPASRAAALLSTMAGWYGMSVVGGPATVSSGGPGGTTSFVPININLGGTQMASLLAALIPAAQQQKIRTGTTGLT